MADGLYGRSDAEWDRLTDEGLRFLRERARLERTTSYTELNATLHNRTGARLFDFSLDVERAAMGHLLGCIVERDRPESGHMISALVSYLGENDAGPGFFKLAQQYGLLPRGAGADAKLTFWSSEVAAIYQHYKPTSQATRPANR